MSVYVPTIDCYSALKRKGVLAYTTAWMELEEVSETSRSLTETQCVASVLWGSWNRETDTDRRKSPGFQALQAGGKGPRWDRVLAGDHGKVLKVDGGDGCTTV